MVGGIGVATSVRAFVRQKLDLDRRPEGARRGLAPGARRVPAADRAARAGRQRARRAPGQRGPARARAHAHARSCPSRSTLSFSLRAVLGGLAMGAGVTLLFALWPLLDIRRVPPALILRIDVEPRLPGRRPWLAAVPIAAGARRARLLAGRLLEDRRALRGRPRRRARPPRASAPGSSSRWPAACAGARPPGGRPWPISTAPAATRAPVLVSLGLAVMLIVAVALLEQSLRARARRPRPRQRARVLLHRHPARPGRALRAARDGPGRDHARRADARRPLAAGRGQRRLDRADERARSGKTSGTSRASTC